MKTVFVKLEKIEKEVKRVKEEYESATYGKEYYLLECSSLEEFFWSRSFRGLRNQVNDLIDTWELEVMRLNLIHEEMENNT